MFPFRHSSIFRSRWIALLWAAGIIWFAMDVAASPEAGGDQDSSAPAGDAEAKQTQKLLEDLGR